MVVLTFPISIWYCFKVFKISQNDRQHRFTFTFSGRQRVRESSHLQAGWPGLFRLSNIPTKRKWLFSSFPGRLKHGGARGPGLFFVLPYVDSYRKVLEIFSAFSYNDSYWGWIDIRSFNWNQAKLYRGVFYWHPRLIRWVEALSDGEFHENPANEGAMDKKIFVVVWLLLKKLSMHWNNRQSTKIIIRVCIETSITLQIGLRAGCYDIDEQLIMTKVLICAIRLTSLQLIKGRLSALILLNNWFMFIVHIFSRTRSQWRWTPSSSSRSISMIQRRGRRGGGGWSRTLRDHKI